MRTAGIIVEYNPFHNGHKYHLDQVKKLTGADYIVAIMSGSFVQRGIPAITDKYTRTQMALECGADAVLELPLVYAAASAEIFAKGAVSILNGLNCIDFLVFGSESDNLELMKNIAKALLSENGNFQSVLKELVAQGSSYPAARQEALKTCFPPSVHDEISQILRCSNNILAIEYLKALLDLKSSICPVTVTRRGSSYNEEALPLGNYYPSATALREVYHQEGSLSNFGNYVPKQVNDILSKRENIAFPVYIDDFSEYLYYRLLYGTWEDLLPYADVSNELARRICSLREQFTSISDFTQKLKTKQYTYTRIQRALLHIMLGIQKEESPALYGRILGFKKEAAFILDRKKASIPLITKPADFKDLIERDVAAANLYNRVILKKFNYTMKNDYIHPLVILP